MLSGSRHVAGCLTGGPQERALNLDVRIRIAPNTPNSWENSMNRTVVSGIAAFALLIGAGLAMSETAEAGNCGGGLFSKLHAKKCGGGGLFSGHHRDRGCGGGGLFSGHHRDRGCGGGLFARLKAKHASSCCAPEPACCEPAPEPCCAAAPAPCGVVHLSQHLAARLSRASTLLWWRA